MNMGLNRNFYRATVQHSGVSRTVAANVASRNLSELIAELLRLSDGRARISSCDAGFRFRPEPPDDVEQWVRR
jgi:hypothetical protein